MYNIIMVCTDVFYEEKYYANTEREELQPRYTTGYVIGGYVCF
ncbi:MAG: hypothetical protein ACLR2O_06600 [Coprococcus sp.]